ncbi:MAG: tRNA (N(6)-L-threonylcarbamoyladenosine(37)-C(2))-methylthiotransferase MtaB [Deltaproteobacteria bacterium]|jgi:threonylcarbamoyladenosine tRNA methylthiotransferase MtaB|nr:tRNA (N(6)-L-threonylcarbamoyladenosine(37)-C(2))-methylthiotransferase MtaB [Deltaproteobacteria bacterium]
MKASIITLGCKVNQFESTAMSQMLSSIGYEMVDAVDADLVIVNTCTVTHKADGEAVSIIKRLKRSNPKVNIVGTGCLAQIDPGALSGPGLADIVLGQIEKADIIRRLNLPKGSVEVSQNLTEFSDFGDPRPSRTRAFHKIQDGCKANCSYCAVPLARGSSRSQPLERALKGIENYLDMGIKEVVLTGIHLGHWGGDLEPKLNLTDLLNAIDGGFGDELADMRIRLSSLEPLEIPLVTDALSKFSWLAPHIHAPVQSGSDRILSLMRRPYDQGRVYEILKRLKDDFVDLNLGTDIICGFPSETEEDFQESLKLLELLPFGYLHVFPFSPRAGTKAASLEQAVPEEVKRRRVSQLRRLGKVKKQTFLKTQLGRTRRALVENTPHRASGRAKILTDNYIQALLPKGFIATPGEAIEVTIAPCDNPWDLATALP